ncbi:ATP-binding protein [Secundilactobacillus sp. HBUAS58055]|nr:AAA family ATPase [Secundilactobacillus angelensis]MCH5462506.1 ATP-binding protein [Secundilactobacillus angelensis]
MQNKLSFLEMTVRNHPLLESKLTFSLLAEQRVMMDQHDSLTKLFGRNWVNNIATLVGKNATGKTTIMKLIMGVLGLLIQNKSISQTKLDDVLIGEKPINVTTLWCGSDAKIYRDEIEFQNQSGEWIISQEKIFGKKVSEQVTKKDFLKFKGTKPLLDRNNLNEVAASVLADDDSVFRSIIKTSDYQVPAVVETLFYTDYNALVYTPGKEVPGEILAYLDPTIEYLRLNQTKDGNFFYQLKFRGEDNVITEKNFLAVTKYLSSGTAKGVTLYADIIAALKSGGIIFIDELENHFNHSIARTFMEYFTNPKINLNRSTLIFSTHYSEFLDEIDRGDQIFIARRDGKISLTRYSDTDMRPDISKSEVFQADNLGGTSPSYNAYIRLKNATIKAIKGDA